MDPAAGDWEALQLTHERRGTKDASIDVARGRFPYCIVWTALPGITWLFPFIGHMGIADSRGVVYDFAGPYHIGVDDLAFGTAMRYLQLDPAKARRREGQTAQEAWDAAVDSGCDVYCTRMHNICCDNCHSHVARVLSEMGYGGRSDWGMVGLAAWLFFSGKHVSPGRALALWLPALVAAALVLGLVFGLGGARK